jgi:cell division protease FtsH
MVYGQKEELVFLGREISEQRDYSELVAQEIDSEVRRLISEAHDRALSILTQYRDNLDAIAQRLIEVETLDAVEFEKVFPSPVARPGNASAPVAKPVAPPAALPQAA